MIELPNMASWIAGCEAERDKLTDPYGIHMVHMVIVHSVIEAERDWVALAPTIHDDAVYQHAGCLPDRVNNKEQQLESYQAVDRASPGFIARMEQDMEHVVVGPDAVAMEGNVYLVCKGSELPVRQLELPEGDSPDDDFLISWRLAIFIPFKEGLLLAEDTYSGQATIVKKLSPEMTRTRRALGRVWSDA
jgi:hypothetical protein